MPKSKHAVAAIILSILILFPLSVSAKMMNSSNDAKALADINRQMDNGSQPYVKLNNSRVAVMPEAIKHFNLKQGQAITEEIFIEILKYNISQLEKKARMNKQEI